MADDPRVLMAANFWGRNWSASTKFLFLNPHRDGLGLSLFAGRGTDDPCSACISFADTDYARDMCAALGEAARRVNAEWGVPEAALAKTFTGRRDPETGVIVSIVAGEGQP